MTELGGVHNKFETCQGCPDRCADPNCHDTCEGYKTRVDEWHAQKDVKMQNIEIWQYKHESIRRDIIRRKHQKRKRNK